MRRIALICSAALLLLGLAACEDDPILQPGSSQDDGGGSYGIINLDTAQSSLPDPSEISANPKTF